MLQKTSQASEWVNSVTPQGHTNVRHARAQKQAHTQMLKMGGESTYVTGNVFLSSCFIFTGTYGLLAASS